MFYRVFHYFHHPIWGKNPIFGGPPIYSFPLNSPGAWLTTLIHKLLSGKRSHGDRWNIHVFKSGNTSTQSGGPHFPASYVRWSRSVLHLGAWEIISLFLTVSRKISMVTSFYWMLRKFKSFSQQQLASPKSNKATEHKCHPQKMKLSCNHHLSLANCSFETNSIPCLGGSQRIVETDWLDVESSKQLWRSLLPKKRWTGSTLQ